jgi:hypothetical protein
MTIGLLAWRKQAAKHTFLLLCWTRSRRCWLELKSTSVLPSNILFLGSPQFLDQDLDQGLANLEVEVISYREVKNQVAISTYSYHKIFERSRILLLLTTTFLKVVR